MKRNREETQPAGAGKRRSGSSRPAQAPAQPTAMGGTKLTTNDALSYLREVKNRFADKKDVYDTFLEIMKEFKACKLDTHGVIEKVKRLFKGHNELIMGFNTFLPRDHQIELKDLPDGDKAGNSAKAKEESPVEFDQAINYVNKVKTRFADKSETYKAFLDVLNVYRRNLKTIDQVYDEVMTLFEDHLDLREEFMLFLPNPDMMKRQAWERKQQQRKAADAAGAPAADGRSLRPQHKRKSKADGHRRDDDEENMARGPGRPQLVKELAFFERAKQRLRNKDAYTDFLKVLGLYTQEIISRQELLQLLNDIMGRYPDLMSGFHEFIAKCDHMEVDEQAIREQAEQQRKRDEERQRRKYLTKPLSEIVAGEKKRVTPSYVKMPPGYPHLATSGRDALADSVLNIEFVNVITGSEDYSFKLMRKNQYEEALFRCEDDRYDFEIAIERNKATMKRLEPLVAQIKNMTEEEREGFRLDEKVLGPVHWRSIENLYGEQAPVVLEQLRKSPAIVLPIVVARMEQKHIEWRRVLAEMTEVWREIYESNYHKSLDHRSFYFKQAEKKALLPKTLVAELREAADQRRQDPRRTLQALSQAFRFDGVLQASTTDLAFEYPEKAVFNDIYRILRTAVDESLGGSGREQVLELYLSLLEPFFGQEVRQAELDAVRAAAAESEDDGDAAGSRPAGAAGSNGRGPGAARGRGGSNRNGQQQHQQQQQQQPGGAAGGARQAGDGGDASAQSEGSDQEGMRTEQDVTPEPRPVDGGKEAGTSDKEGDDDETSADAGRGQGEDSAGGAGTAGAARAQVGISDRLERAYAACKPLAAYTGCSTSRHVPAGHRLLFGNENIYVFYRYHRILYERLCTARKCVQTKCNADAAESLRQQQADAGRGGAVTPEPPQARAAAFEQLHESFMSMLLNVIRGHLESGAYEDQCRSALGTGSYELFTLDKLSAKIVKHMQLMLQDDNTAKLWELHRYECSRGVPIHTTLYHINCHGVLTDDPCYRLTYDTATSTLNVSLVEFDKAPEVLGSVSEAVLSDYIRPYVSTPAPLQSPNYDYPSFLRRNLSQRARQSPDAELVDVMKSVAICNDLECRINCISSQLSYVSHTEDVLCRRQQCGRPEPEGQKRLRAARFERWLSQRNPAQGGGQSPSRDDSAMDAVMALARIAPGM